MPAVKLVNSSISTFSGAAALSKSTVSGNPSAAKSMASKASAISRNSGVSSWTSISKSNIKAGDLLFFSVRGGSTVGHVGIYMGNGKMIDASSSRGKVRTTSNIQSSSYWTSHFICGFRIF